MTREDAIRAEGTEARPAKPPGLWMPLVPGGPLPVHVDPILVVVFAWLVVQSTPEHALWVPATILLGSVMLHEVAHALVAKARGLVVSGVFLHLVPFAYVERGEPKDELTVALAGPALNLLIAGVLWFLPGAVEGFAWGDIHAWFDEPLHAAFAINLLMGVFNLVPALPADGGRALRAGLMTVQPAAVAYAWTAGIGTFVGAACLFVAVWLWPSTDALIVAMLGAFFILTAWREAQAGREERRRARERAREERAATD